MFPICPCYLVFINSELPKIICEHWDLPIKCSKHNQTFFLELSVRNFFQKCLMEGDYVSFKKNK